MKNTLYTYFFIYRLPLARRPEKGNNFSQSIGKNTTKVNFHRHEEYRSYHTKKFHQHLTAIYKLRPHRKSPITEFEEKPLHTLLDLKTKLKIKTFFKKLIKSGGIYKFTLKNKKNVFYIGATENFAKRF
jgi:hypothetical protein